MPALTRPPPAMREQAPPPDLAEGHCITGAAGVPASAWTSDSQYDRAQAMAACLACPVLRPCREWALAQPGRITRTGVVVGGLLPRPVNYRLDPDAVAEAEAEAAARAAAAADLAAVKAATVTAKAARLAACRAELERDHRRPNPVIAASAGVPLETVRKVRHGMEAAGVIESYRATAQDAQRWNKRVPVTPP